MFLLSAFLLLACGNDVAEQPDPDAGVTPDPMPDAMVPNTAPQIVDIPDTSILEDSGTSSAVVVIGDEESGLGGLNVTATSSNQTIIPDTNLSLSRVGPTYMLDYFPAPDQNGSVTITVTVDDGEASANDTFAVEVVPVNDAPAFTLAGGDLTVAIDATAQSFPGHAGGVDVGPSNESSQGFAFNVSATNASLFSELPAISESGELTFTPAPGRWGTATVTVSVTDTGGTENGGIDTSEEQTFTITVDCLVAPPPDTFFVGDYLMEQLSGLDPFFSAETFGDTQVVTLTANGHDRDFDFLYFPGIFDSDYHFRMKLCDGSIYVRGFINAGSLGCGGGGPSIGFSTGTPPATYAGTGSEDDNVVPVNVFDFDPDGNCDTEGYSVELRFTEQTPPP